MKKSVKIAIPVLGLVALAVVLAGPKYLEAQEENAQTIEGQFLEAVDKGDVEAASRLIEKGIDVNAMVPPGGTTALILSASAGHADMVKLLIKKGANVNGHDVNGKSALLGAAEGGHTEIVRLLIERGADVHASIYGEFYVEPYCEASLSCAAFKGHEDVVRLLLEHGAYVHGVDDSGRTVLMGAAEAGHADIVKMLIDKDADVNYRSEDGVTALGLAEKKGYTDVVKLLREHGAK